MPRRESERHEPESLPRDQRPDATVAYHPRIAVVLDFDGTLAPDTFDTLLECWGEDPRRFERERHRPLLEDGWENMLSRIYQLVELSRERGEPITREFVAEVGRSVEPFDGVPEMFDAVRRWARGVISEVEVEFYLLTCGLVDVHRHTGIASEFRTTWGTELGFDGDGELAFAKQVVTFPEKVRYLLAMSKGIGVDGPNGPADVYRRVRMRDLHVPLDQVVYVGDGLSDMPAFGLMNAHGGPAIGIYKAENAERWSAMGKAHRGRRVENLAPSDYSEGSELMRSLRICTELVANRVALRGLGKGE